MSNGAASLTNDLLSFASTTAAASVINSGSKRVTSLSSAVRSKTSISSSIAKQEKGKLGLNNSEIPTLLKKYLGNDSRAFHNNYKDLIIESKDGMKQFRIDLNHPLPHKNPHSHLIEYGTHKNKKFEIFNQRIYPKDVYPE